MARTPGFTFKYFHELDKMAVTYYCQDPEPNEEAWDKIKKAEFFDIKLYPYISIEEYIPIIIKINTITKSKPGISTIHFSNELLHVFSEEHEKLFWKLLEYIKHSNYELQIEYRISTVVEDEFRMPTNFFNKVVSYAKKNKIQRLRLSVFDKDNSEHLFFRKNNNDAY